MPAITNGRGGNSMPANTGRNNGKSQAATSRYYDNIYGLTKVNSTEDVNSKRSKRNASNASMKIMNSYQNMPINQSSSRKMITQMMDHATKTERSHSTNHENDATKLTNNMWNKISKIVHKCERAQQSNQKFITNFRRVELCDELR